MLAFLSLRSRDSRSHQPAPAGWLSAPVTALVPALLVCLASIGCDEAHLPTPTPPQALPATFVSILTPEVSITGQDQKWSLAGQDPTGAPFISAWPEELSVAATPALLELSPHFLRKGAQRCFVKVPGRDKPLYGVLALLPVYVTSPNSSARRTYRMDIKPENVQPALGGQVSVVYEPYDYTYDTIAVNPQTQKGYISTVKGEAPSWVLWISDAPFAAPPAGAPAIALTPAAGAPPSPAPPAK